MWWFGFVRGIFLGRVWCSEIGYVRLGNFGYRGVIMEGNIWRVCCRFGRIVWWIKGGVWMG